jgi:uncharacterized surface protein with fasciclin (FAS1) repeats
MKKMAFVLSMMTVLFACSESTSETTATPNTSTGKTTGQSGVQDDVSNPNIVQVAAKSPDHTTLVSAVQAAELVDALSNAGPFTVFAPTNAAFDKLPAGTVEGLLKAEKKADLKSILEYHTYVGVLKTDYMSDGQQFEQVSGQKIKISKQGDQVIVNDKAHIVATITTSNGIIHVIDEVLLPQ